MEGQTVTMVNGYPSVAATGIQRTLVEFLCRSRQRLRIGFSASRMNFGTLRAARS